MVAAMIVVLHESLNLVFEVVRQEAVFEQDAAFEGLVPALDLAYCLRLHLSALNTAHNLAMGVTDSSGLKRLAPTSTRLCNPGATWYWTIYTQ
jgi:hypothetical protein